MAPRPLKPFERAFLREEILANIELAPRPPKGSNRKPPEIIGRHMTIRLPPDLWIKLHASDKKMIEIIERALRLYFLIEED